MYNIIFPALPGSRKVAPFWEKESQAAEAAGFGISIISDINDRGPVRMTNNSADHYLYRGWIVKPPYYQEASQLVKGSLITSYDDYLWTFEFPRWYGAIPFETPQSMIFTAEQIQSLGLTQIAEQVSKLNGPKSMMIKDWLKSRKHEWYDACFIKDATNIADSVRVMTNFFELQGRDFYGGLVFRDFIPLKKLGSHPKSGMPLPIEFRTFFLNQKPMITTMYWQNDVSYPIDMESPPQSWLEEIGKKMVSPFVALDIAQSEDGKWWVIEVNDGGTAGYPDHLDPKEFYSLLFRGLNV